MEPCRNFDCESTISLPVNHAGIGHYLCPRTGPDELPDTWVFLVRPDGFEPPTTWFEDAHSKRYNTLKNKVFWHFRCATKPPVTAS
jgi:hypothetical protein